MALCSAIARSTGKQCQRHATRGDFCGGHAKKKDAPQGRLADVAGSGDRLRMLRELRQVVAETIDQGVPPKELASLSLRLVQLTEEIESLTGGREEQASVDDLAARRAERRAAAAGSS